MKKERVNWSELKKFCLELDLELAEMLEIYFTQANNENSRLDEALESNDFKTIASISHKLIGSSSTLFFTSLFELYTKLNQSAKYLLSLECETHISAIKQELKIVEAQANQETD